MKLHQNSVNYVEKTFEQYRQKERTDGLTITNPIVHMYPIKDTYDESGNLNGYIDALFFKIDIYDRKNLIKYTSDILHDSLSFMGDNCSPHDIKIFKDGSTMIVFLQKITFEFLSTVCIYGRE